MANTVNTTNIPTDWAYILGQVAGMFVANDDSRPVIAEMRKQGIVKDGLAGWATLTRKGRCLMSDRNELALRIAHPDRSANSLVTEPAPDKCTKCAKSLLIADTILALGFRRDAEIAE